MRLSVCVDAVFNGWDFIEAMEAVKKAGLNAFEFWAWWNKDVNAIIKAKERLGLETAAFCTRFVSLVDPEKRPEYIKGLEETLEVAKLLECKTIISQVGNEIPGVSREAQRLSLIQGLKECVPLLENFHAAGNPGRHELSNGEINYPQVFKAIKQGPYEGYVGLEYFPLEDSVKGLQKLSLWI